MKLILQIENANSLGQTANLPMHWSLQTSVNKQLSAVYARPNSALLGMYNVQVWWKSVHSDHTWKGFWSLRLVLSTTIAAVFLVWDVSNRYHLRIFQQLPHQTLDYLNGNKHFLTLKGLWQINARFGIKVWNLGPILVNKMLQKWQWAKIVINKSCAPDLIFFNEKKFEGFGWFLT